MHPFEETISIAGAIVVVIVAAIVVLTLFYRGLAWLTGSSSKADTIAVRGVLKTETRATVHVSGKEPFERVRLIGYTNADSIKGRIPYELNGMIILEDEQKTRFLIRARDIRMIEVPPDTGSPQD